MPIQFPEPYKHDHPPVTNVNEAFEEVLTRGHRASDFVARLVGSWKFIIIQSIILVLWAGLNGAAWFYHWDPYPFILMNLFLSMQAAFTAPIIMMSQNRQSLKDRLDAHNDFQVNQKAEEEIRAIMDHLAAQDIALKEIHLKIVDSNNGKTTG